MDVIKRGLLIVGSVVALTIVAFATYFLLAHPSLISLILFFMIGISLLMALGFLGAFIWSMRTGQQDDLYTPSLRMLLDDTPPGDITTADPTRQTAPKTSTTAV